MVRTKGDLCGLTILTESTYGVVPSGTGSYAGTTLTFSDSDEATTEEALQCGSRARGDVFVTSVATGYSATFNHVRGQGWEDWVTRAVGALTGVQRTTPSFDTCIRVSPSETHLFTGCRVNSLGISAPSVGAKVEFSVDVMARWHTKNPFKDSDGSTLTMSLVAIPSGVPVTYLGNWEYSLNGTTFQRVGAKSFTLSIASNLTADPGASSTGTTAIGLEAGEGSAPQDSEITLDLTITSKDDTWDDLRLARTTGMSFRAVIDGKTVLLTGCNLHMGGPTRSQGTYDETITVTATDIRVT